MDLRLKGSPGTGGTLSDPQGTWLETTLTVSSGAVLLKNLTVTNEYCQNGGQTDYSCESTGIRNSGTLTLQDVSVTYNGGGIYSSGTLSLIRSTVAYNGESSGTGFAPGVWNSGQATIQGSTVTHNSGGDDTGGINNWGDMTIDASTISDNVSSLGSGGISNGGRNGGTLVITRSTLVGNRSSQTDHGGGGIGNTASLVVVSSTIVNNWVTTSAAGSSTRAPPRSRRRSLRETAAGVRTRMTTVKEERTRCPSSPAATT